MASEQAMRSLDTYGQILVKKDKNVESSMQSIAKRWYYDMCAILKATQPFQKLHLPV
jgi:hypothetical protein